MAQPSEPPPPAYSESPHVGHPSQPNVNAGGTRPEPQRYSSEQEEPLPLDEDGDRELSDVLVRQQTNDLGLGLTETASMEDEERPLPPGWVRQYDPNSKQYAAFHSIHTSNDVLTFYCAQQFLCRHVGVDPVLQP